MKTETNLGSLTYQLSAHKQKYLFSKSILHDKILMLPQLRVFGEDAQTVDIQLRKGNNHCGKRRKCWLKALYPGVVKNRDCAEMVYIKN